MHADKNDVFLIYNHFSRIRDIKSRMAYNLRVCTQLEHLNGVNIASPLETIKCPSAENIKTVGNVNHVATASCFAQLRIVLSTHLPRDKTSLVDCPCFFLFPETKMQWLQTAATCQYPTNVIKVDCRKGNKICILTGDEVRGGGAYFCGIASK